MSSRPTARIRPPEGPGRRPVRYRPQPRASRLWPLAGLPRTPYGCLETSRSRTGGGSTTRSRPDLPGAHAVIAATIRRQWEASTDRRSSANCAQVAPPQRVCCEPGTARWEQNVSTSADFPRSRSEWARQSVTSRWPAFGWRPLGRCVTGSSVFLASCLGTSVPCAADPLVWVLNPRQRSRYALWNGRAIGSTRTTRRQRAPIS
jgi:hypothetical protein